MHVGGKRLCLRRDAFATAISHANHGGSGGGAPCVVRQSGIASHELGRLTQARDKTSRIMCNQHQQFFNLRHYHLSIHLLLTADALT